MKAKGGRVRDEILRELEATREALKRSRQLIERALQMVAANGCGETTVFSRDAPVGLARAIDDVEHCALPLRTACFFVQQSFR
jgi:hypothetical protein